MRSTATLTLALLLSACSGVVGELAPDDAATDTPDAARSDRPAALDAPAIDAPTIDALAIDAPDAVAVVDRATPVDRPPVAVDDGVVAYDRPDVSTPVDPCRRATLGNGAYCGAGLGGDAAVLYECRDGATASQMRCERGCAPQPAGVADRCAPPPVTGRCCLLRPPGSFVRGFSACGHGGSHYGIDSGAVLGTAITAGLSGTVLSVATGNPNCPYNEAVGTCPSTCVNQFNYVKIRADCGDPSDGSRDLIVYYLHVDRLAPGIGAGTHVNQGDVIAYVGNSGCSSGPHVHVEIVPVARGANAVLNTCASVDPATRYCP